MIRNANILSLIIAVALGMLTLLSGCDPGSQGFDDVLCTHKPGESIFLLYRTQ